MSSKPYRRKRKIMRALKLTEISAVDTPAQEGARMVLLKRHDEAEKAYGLVDVLTSSDNDHQHGVQVHEGYAGEGPTLHVTYASGPDGENHSHDIMRDADGNLILSENQGHTHTLDAAAVTQALMSAMIGKHEETEDPKSSVSVAAIIAGTRDPVSTGKSADDLGNQPTGEDTMAENNADALSADLKKRDEEIARLRAVIDLTPEHRAHYDNQPISKRDSFLALNEAQRAEEIETAEKANPVVYTAEDGTEYRKSDDDRLVKMAKERDQDRADMAKFRVEAEQATFEKKAEEVLGLIPGERVEKIALIRVVSSIEDDDTRDKAFGLLETANKVYRMALGTEGVSETIAPANVGIAKASDLLEQAVEACMKEDGVKKAEAYKRVLDTAQGQRLYDAARNERVSVAN